MPIGTLNVPLHIAGPPMPKHIGLENTSGDEVNLHMGCALALATSRPPDHGGAPLSFARGNAFDFVEGRPHATDDECSMSQTSLLFFLEMYSSGHMWSANFNEFLNIPAARVTRQPCPLTTTATLPRIHACVIAATASTVNDTI